MRLLVKTQDFDAVLQPKRKKNAGVSPDKPVRGSIIVVEDDLDVRRFLRIVLEDAGFSVFEAETGEECLSLIMRIVPSAILLDVNLPGMSGFTVCQNIHDHYPGMRCPVIFITTRRTRADLELAREVGGSFFLVKPLTAEKVLHTIKYCMGRQRLRRVKQPNASSL